jgi:hypothetical protein
MKIKMKEFEKMCRHYAEGAKDIEWVIATMLQFEYGAKRTTEYLNRRDHVGEV